MIGIGINLQMPESFSKNIDQAWTDLNQHTQKLDKNQLVASLTYHLEQRLVQYRQTGLQDMYEQWNSLNAFAGDYVELNTGHRSWRGICEGIDPQGGIRIRQDGEVKSYYGGEVSLRKAQV